MKKKFLLNRKNYKLNFHCFVNQFLKKNLLIDQKKFRQEVINKKINNNLF